MPARLAGRAARALRDQAQARRLSGLRRQLQPPPFTQIKRAGDLDHHQRDSSVPERLFGHGERVGLILRPRDQNTRGIADRREAHGVERSGLPVPTQPEQMPLALRAGDSGKTGRTRSADLMNAGRTQGRRGVRVRCRRHRLKSYHIQKRSTGTLSKEVLRDVGGTSGRRSCRKPNMAGRVPAFADRAEVPDHAPAGAGPIRQRPCRLAAPCAGTSDEGIPWFQLS